MKHILTAALSGLFVLLVACTTSSVSETKTQTGPFPYQDKSLAIEKRVDDLLARMTIEEKVGQMTQSERNALKSSQDIRQFGLGSLLSGGGSVPADNSPAGWRKMIEGFQKQAMSTRLAIPLLYGIDAVHGHNNVYGATMFPHNIGLGATRDADLVYQVERATAEEIKATGIPWSFAPCIAVVQDIRWGRTYEGFSRDPELNAQLALAAVRGFQGDKLGETGVTATLKHFVADGGTDGGHDQGNSILTADQLESIHLRPYSAALKAHPGTVMASFSSVNGLKMHENKDLLTGWLKEKQGFDGFVISDWAAVKQLQGTSAQQITKAVNAGIDMVMVPDNYTDFIRDLLADVKDGQVPVQRIDDAVRRILRVKFALGLFENPIPLQSSPDRGAALFASEAHKDIARKAVRESFTLLKNDQKILPLSAEKNAKKILVIGEKGDDVGIQSGGWTLTWQGGRGEITPGVTIYQGLVSEFGEENVQFSISADIPEDFKPDVVLCVVGERPYAEGQGDSTTLLPDADDLQLWSDLKAEPTLSKLPVVTLVVSGRPLILGDILKGSQAVAEVWLPGSEAGALAQVISGKFKPVGKLPQPWPQDRDQKQPLFPYGYGLTY